MFDTSTLGKKRRQKKQQLKILFCFFFISLFVLNFIKTYDLSKNIGYSNENLSREEEDFFNDELNIPEVATDILMLQDPFTKNFDSLLNFFRDNYESKLTHEVSTYFRYGDPNGTIIDDRIYSEDNLLLYKTLMKPQISEIETFDTYLKLKSTPLWYEGNEQFSYGFVKSVYNSTGQIAEENRYLVDNLLPIFLLIENIGDNIDTLSISGKYPKDSIEEMFFLINSSEFWDQTNKGFSNNNKTSGKNTESNLYSILANLLIHRTFNQLNLDANIKDRAYYLANQTMLSIRTNMSGDSAYYYNASATWDTSGPGEKYYHLSVNALGIITLLEFWIESGMKNDSFYLTEAIDIYNSLEKLRGPLNKDAYQNIANPSWVIIDPSYNLQSNALMMKASLKLYELLGNITYYNRAINISTFFEENLYDTVNNAYNSSLLNGDKNFNSNLELSEVYLRSFDVYNSTRLRSEFNTTNEIPNYVFNQDNINLNSTYSFTKEDQYYDPLTDSYKTYKVDYNITDHLEENNRVEIKYLFKYPNGTFINQFEEQILYPNSTTLSYPIEETLPLGDGYFIYVWANSSYFGLAQTVKRFNVISGLINKTIEGLANILYQGPIINVTLPINYTRSDNLTLTTSLEGENIINYPSQSVNFTAFEEVRLQFNLTAKLGAIPGPSEITFKIKRGNIIYLLVKKVIDIGYSFDYDNLIYQSKVVKGENIYVSLDLINFLPNVSQSLNISFVGLSEYSIETFTQEENLIKNEVKTISYYLKTLENIGDNAISVEMRIFQNNTVFYSEILTIEIMPKYELISVSFPSTISQGATAHLIVIIQNNQEKSEIFSLYINDKLVQTNINQLGPGENRIVKEILTTINPYEFGSKIYRITLKNSDDEEIVQFYFKLNLELSIFNLLFFYLLPFIIPIGIVLYFVNKEIKHKKLRR